MNITPEGFDLRAYFDGAVWSCKLLVLGFGVEVLTFGLRLCFRAVCHRSCLEGLWGIIGCSGCGLGLRILSLKFRVGLAMHLQDDSASEY